MAVCKEEDPILLRKSSDGKLSLPCQGDLRSSAGMATTPLSGSVEDETLLLKNTFSGGTPLPVINESFIDQLKSGMDDSHLFPIFCTKTIQKRNSADTTMNTSNSSWTNQTFTKKTSHNLRTKQYDLSSSSLDSTLNASGNKISEITKTNPFKKPRVKKVKTSFALDTTQEDNVSLEEERQKYKPVESKTNPFKKNLKRKKFSVTFEKTFDSSNESIPETDKTPAEEDSISTNNDSVKNEKKECVTQNPFKKSNKRKRYSIVGKLDSSGASTDKQSETVDVQGHETIFNLHNVPVADENTKHNPFMKVNLPRFSFNATLDTSDPSNESNINKKRIEENTEIQQLNQPNSSTSMAIQEDLSVKNYENVQVDIKAGVPKCLKFNESLVSQADSIKTKEQSQEITSDVENSAMCTLTTIAEIHPEVESQIQIPMESMEITCVETSKVSEISRERILQFLETGATASQNVDKSKILPSNETKSSTSISSDKNSNNRETKDENVGNKVEDSKEDDDDKVASNENISTLSNERDEVLLNNILSSPISNTTLNSVRAVSEETNNNLPANSEINKTRQISSESNNKNPNISEEEISPQRKQPHATLSHDVETLSVCTVTTIAEIHACKESESESCPDPTSNQTLYCGSNEVKGNNVEAFSQTMEIGTHASQNKIKLLTKGTESCNSVSQHVNPENMIEPNDAIESDEKEIHKEAEPQAVSNENLPISSGADMATTQLGGSVEDETFLLKTTFSEGTTLPVISECVINQLKSGMHESHLPPTFCKKTSIQKRNTAHDTTINTPNSNWTNQTFTKKTSDNSQTKQHDLSSSSLDSTSGHKINETFTKKTSDNSQTKQHDLSSSSLDSTSGHKINGTFTKKTSVNSQTKQHHLSSSSLDSTSGHKISGTFTKKTSDNSQTKQHDLSNSSLDTTSGHKISEKFTKKTSDNSQTKQHDLSSSSLDTTSGHKITETFTKKTSDNSQTKQHNLSSSSLDSTSGHKISETFTKKTSGNSQTKQHDVSNSSLDTTSGHKISEITNRNPFKNLRGEKVKTSFALDITQEENVSFEENIDIEQLNQPNLLTSMEMQEDVLMKNYENIEVEINASAQKCSDFNESLVSRNDSIKNRDQSQEYLDVGSIISIAEIHSREEPLTEISAGSTQVLSIEASEFSENSNEGILQFVEIETVASQNVDMIELLPEVETEYGTLLNSDMCSQNRAELKDANVGDEVEDFNEVDAKAVLNENLLTLPDERCSRDEVVVNHMLSSPISNATMNSVRLLSEERNNILSTNSEINKVGQISPESNHKKQSNIFEEIAPQSKQPYATTSDGVENLSACKVTTIAEIHSCKEFELEICTKPNEKVDCGSNEVRENNAEEISQIIEVGTMASQNIDENELLTEGRDSCNTFLGLHVNPENLIERERDEKEIHKEVQIGSNGSVPTSLGMQCLDDESNNISLGNNVLSSSSNAVAASAPQLSEKKEMPKNVENGLENIPSLSEDEILRNEEKLKTGTDTVPLITEPKNNISAHAVKICTLPTRPPSNAEENDELSVEQSPVRRQTGNSRFLEDECALNKDYSKSMSRRKSPRIAGLSFNKSNEVINTSKNKSSKYRETSKNLREINAISPAVIESTSKGGDVDKEINVSINIAAREAPVISLNCKPDKKSVEANISNRIQKVTPRNEVSKMTRQNECLKDVTSELISDEYNRDTGGTYIHKAVDSNEQKLSDSGKTSRKSYRIFSVGKSILKSNTERNEGVANSKRQTPLKDVNRIITESPKLSSKEKEKLPDFITTKGNNEHFGELSLSFDVSAIPNNKLISSKKRKCISTPLVQRSTRSKRLSVNVLSQNKNRKSSVGDNLSTISANKQSKETENVLKEKTLNSANDFEFAAPKYATRKSSISTVKKPRRSVTFRKHSSLIPSQDDYINTKKSNGGSNGRKFSIDMQTSEGKKSKNSMVQSSGKIVSTDKSVKYNSKKLNNYSAVDNKTNKDPSYETTLDVSEIALQTPKQRKRLLFHSTPKNRITSLGTPLARKRLRHTDNQETPRSSSSLYSTTESDALPSDSYTPTISRTLRNSSSNSNKNLLSYNSHTCMATRIAATSAHQSNRDNSRAQNGTKTTSNRSVEEPCNSELLLEESSCFNRPPDDSFSTCYSGENESVRPMSVLEGSAIIMETHERSIRNGTMHMTLRSSRTTLQHSAVYSETQLNEITHTTVNESNLVPEEKSLSLISKFSKNKKRKDSVFGNVEKKKVTSHNEPLPKLAKPAKWIKKELYTFLDKKLSTKYTLEKRYHCERLVLILHNAVTNTLMGHPELSLNTLKKELINYGICKTQLDYFTFINRYTPLEFIKKTVPLGRAYGNEDFEYKQIGPYDPLE